MGSKFSRRFYRQDTETVARSLLGQKLVYQLSETERIAAKIIEVEAYLGVKDAACHSFGGRKTPRTETMYLDGGHAYVYFIYGMHFCFNVVSSKAGQPEAVLIRAVEPVEGLEILQKRRKVKNPRDLCNGPAKLCQAFQIDHNCNGWDLTQDPLFIEKAEKISPQMIGQAPRVGIDYAGEAKLWKLRYFIREHPLISKPYPK